MFLIAKFITAFPLYSSGRMTRRLRCDTSPPRDQQGLHDPYSCIDEQASPPTNDILQWINDITHLAAREREPTSSARKRKELIGRLSRSADGRRDFQKLLLERLLR
jgi:hypothetical protein